MAEPKQVKVIKGGLNIAKRLLADGEEAGLTAAQRAEAGKKAAELIKTQPQVKASEALGQLMEKGVKRTTTTQADRTRVGGGNIGGAPFSAISEADPAYAGKVWGVMDEGTAARLKNLTDDETAWTTMLGSASQLKTNPIVFDKLKRGFVTSMKQGNLSDELAGKINHNLALTFGEGADIRDPKIWRQADTFEKRAALADVMMGQGTAPSKGGIAIGGEKSGKGVIFKPTDILKRETEPSLLHTEHGGDVPTFAAGPRLFKLEKESVYDPSLHPGFPTLLKGKDYGINMKPTPTEVFLPDWHKRFKANNPDRKGPGYYDLALGVKGEGLPSQDLHDEYIRHLLREGFKKGGKVDIDAADRRLAQAMANRMSGGGMAKGGSVDIKSADARLQAAIDARMGMAEGGEAGFKKIEFMADGGKLVKGGAKVMKKLMADEAPAINRDANLQNFLAKSQVKEPVFHASKADVKQFSPKHRTGVSSMGHHFGTAEQANFRTTQYDFDSQSPNIGKYHLNVENPLEVSHMASFAPDHLAEQLMDMNLLKPEVYDALSAKHNYDNVAIGDELVKVLRKNGYDGLKYANEREGQGFSYVPLNPTQIKSATGNRGTYDIEDADITKAEGGPAFKKLEFMADGGKLVKGAAQIGKRLMADNSLPALEREANLKKFLEPSKTPMRLYHGTTATEGGKGNEAIRRIKPSKEGALGSGVYMTPKPNYASNYALDHMTPESYASSMGDAFEAGNVLPVHAQIRNPLIIGDTGERIDPAAEALMKLGMDKEKAQLMVERLYEDKGNIGKQIQSRAQSQGYDGLMLYHTDGSLGEVVSYNPNAVKSATGNQGTYDVYSPDLNKSDGGKIVKGLSKVAKKLLEEPRIQTIEAPSIIIPSKLSNVKEMAKKREGEYGARRVERASDEIPNLEKMYQEDALRSAFIGGDNARALMTMNPADFENYAAPLDLKTSIGPKMAEYAKQGDITKDTVPTDEFIKYLRSLQDGFEDIPMLTINKEESGLPLVPYITGHEGRHRSRALAESEQPTSLIQLFPRAELREPFPRRTQEEYIDAIRKEMEMTGNMVRPEVYLHNILEKNVKRDPIKLPDLYAEGGAAFKTLQFKDAQHFDGGGIAFPEMTPMTEGSRREPLLTEKDWENIKRNAPEVYEWAKQNVKDEASQLKSARGVKDFALRTGAQYLGGIPDLLNLGLMGVDALADTNLSSEKPYFGSERYIDAMRKAGMVGENEFPIAETVAGVLMPAGLIKKGIKKISGAKPAKQEPKKRQGGLSAMAR